MLLLVMKILTAIIGYIKNVISVVMITKKLISQFKDMRREHENKIL